MEKYYKELISILKNKKIKKEELNKLKIKLCNKYNLKKIPTDIEVILTGTSWGT